MNRIDKTFDKLRSENCKALIPYVTCGDPSLEFTEQLVLNLVQSGADIVELGVPYSDPVADGPTIQKASARALSNGVALEKIFSLAGRLREKVHVPLIMMTYYNPIYVKGIEEFVKKAASAGIDGFIVPDLPLEEAGPLKVIMDSYDMRLILLATPTTTRGRIERIARLSQGFIYCVSVTGVTGARQRVSEQLDSFLDRIRAKTDLPLAVGFGISGPDTARQAAELADGVIIGSALIDIIEKNTEQGANGVRINPGKALEEVSSFISSVKRAITMENAG